MFIHRHLPACASAAWILISCFFIKAPVAAAEPPAGGAGLTIEQMVGDLEQRAKTLAEEANQPAPGADPAAVKPQDPELMRARMEISRCLIHRSMLTRNKVVPTDPYYQALRRQRLADANLQMAQVWWKHGRTGTALESVESFESLPLATTLGEEKKKADEEVAATKPAGPPPSDDKSRVPLNPAVMTRVKQGGGILDQIQNWENLSEESKSKIIAR